jgi:hypothetical protein
MIAANREAGVGKTVAAEKVKVIIFIFVFRQTNGRIDSSFRNPVQK